MFPSFRTVGYAWGQPLEFTANHVDESRLQSMRYEIDQIGDSVLSAINEHCEYICGECTGNDKQATTSTVINELLSSKLSHSFFMCEPCPSKTTHRELTLEEHEVYASDGTVQNCRTIDARIFEFWRACVQEPVWLDWDLVKHGQKVFYRYSGSAAMGLLYYSLVGGLSAPKIVKVLDSTSYLTQNQDRTWTRLNETLEMVLDVMENEDALRPGNRGWISVLKVRLLHSKVRMMLLNSSWDAATYGLPINQEDMMSTLLSFSVNVLVTIKRLGGRLSRYDEMAYLHLWRYVGFLIGVADEHNPCGDYERAHGALESIVLHLLHPSERSGQVDITDILVCLGGIRCRRILYIHQSEKCLRQTLYACL